MGMSGLSALSGDSGVMGGSAWTPLTLGANLWAWWDFSDQTTLFQDTAATVPVAANNDPIGRCNDKGNNARRLAIPGAGTTRPLWKTNVLNGRAVAQGDGVDDLLQTLVTAPASGDLTVAILYASSNVALTGQAAIRGATWLMGPYGSSLARFFAGGFIGNDIPMTNNVFIKHISTMQDNNPAGPGVEDFCKHYSGSVPAQSGATAVPSSWPGMSSNKYNLFQNGGGGELLAGQIAEVIVINGASAYDANIAALGAYLLAKWAV